MLILKIITCLTAFCLLLLQAVLKVMTETDERNDICVSVFFQYPYFAFGNTLRIYNQLHCSPSTVNPGGSEHAVNAIRAYLCDHLVPTDIRGYISAPALVSLPVSLSLQWQKGEKQFIKQECRVIKCFRLTCYSYKEVLLTRNESSVQNMARFLKIKSKSVQFVIFCLLVFNGIRGACHVKFIQII